MGILRFPVKRPSRRACVIYRWTSARLCEKTADGMDRLRSDNRRWFEGRSEVFGLPSVMETETT